LAKKPKKLSKTLGKDGAITPRPKKTAQREEKKPKQYKSKEQRVADYEELPVIVHFDI